MRLVDEVFGDGDDVEFVVADEVEDVVAFGCFFDVGFDAFECVED